MIRVKCPPKTLSAMSACSHKKWSLFERSTAMVLSALQTLVQLAQLHPVVPTLKSQLAYGIPFHNPSLKPQYRPPSTGCGIAPTERTGTSVAEPALATVRIVTVSYGYIPVVRTSFLGDISPRSIKRFIYRGHILRLSRTENSQPKTHIFDY